MSNDCQGSLNALATAIFLTLFELHSAFVMFFAIVVCSQLCWLGEASQYSVMPLLMISAVYAYREFAFAWQRHEKIETNTKLREAEEAFQTARIQEQLHKDREAVFSSALTKMKTPLSLLRSELPGDQVSSQVVLQRLDQLWQILSGIESPVQQDEDFSVLFGQKQIQEDIHQVIPPGEAVNDRLEALSEAPPGESVHEMLETVESMFFKVKITSQDDIRVKEAQALVRTEFPADRPSVLCWLREESWEHFRVLLYERLENLFCAKESKELETPLELRHPFDNSIRLCAVNMNIANATTVGDALEAELSFQCAEMSETDETASSCDRQTFRSWDFPECRRRFQAAKDQIDGFLGRVVEEPGYLQGAVQKQRKHSKPSSENSSNRQPPGPQFKPLSIPEGVKDEDDGTSSFTLSQ
eukprot:CAMPEP_0197676856 /NCGR_PEP_ID=MMETSP1338-20131121/87487_1 /TAXON_ID=43686 ORGANISM="Pelagodinium beii, Strain RCC1491" /NCGR_SAMPLE_ID=MMETSP1338 /ASSEMBLY_ACC=CAM_ASM_000754 /LENGTH=413 /DNA_ID=CAMNT_0043257591 /DNA_START=131 /DNA_END=1372 /DNA_ORIENTATION=-